MVIEYNVVNSTFALLQLHFNKTRTDSPGWSEVAVGKAFRR